MSTAQNVVTLSRALLQIGITAEQFRTIAANPDMTDEELAAKLANNSAIIEELRDRDHGDA